MKWHIRVVGIDGQAVSQHRALARYLASWLWFYAFFAAVLAHGLAHRYRRPSGSSRRLGGVWAFLSKLHPQQQYWHDVLSGTRLIATDKPSDLSDL